MQTHRNPICSVFCTVIFTPHCVGVLLLYIESNRVIYSMTFRTPDHHFPMVVFILVFGKMWRALLFLFILFPFGALAECVSVGAVTKCARLPESIGVQWLESEVSDTVYDSNGWGGIYNGHMISGTGTNSGSGTEQETTCMIDWPFSAVGACLFNPMFDTENGNYNCANAIDACDMGLDFDAATQLDGDECPDGFYTVPYDVSCGDGLVDTADIPYCNVDTNGDFCLILLAQPCTAGITTIRTGTGVSIPLWAEKSTSPSLCVKYNDTVCYGNLEPGQATGSININYEDQVYHLVD